MVWKFLENYPHNELLQGGKLREEYGYLGKILSIIQKKHPLQEAIISQKIIPYERELVHAAKKVFDIIGMLKKYLGLIYFERLAEERETLNEIDTQIMWGKDKVNRETKTFFQTLMEIVSEQDRLKAELEENQRRLAELDGIASRNIKHLQQDIKEGWDELTRLLITRLRVDTLYWDRYLERLQALENEIQAKETAFKERGVAA